MNGGKRTYLAVDLGASSGRVLGAQFDGQQLKLQELHRFANGPVAVHGHLYWDALGLWREIQDGLRAATQSFGDSVASIGVDTWGVDFALLDRNDQLLGNPYHYRDPQTQGVMEKASERVSRSRIFASTGLQFMELNTLYQLIALHARRTPTLEMAQSFLMMPDLFNWMLTGEKINEFTNATTTQFFNPQTKSWAKDLLKQFDLPTDMLLDIAQPGTQLGPLLPAVQHDTGLGPVPVILPGTHDTASAVLAVPSASIVSDRPDWCYISSGTWSLMGVEVAQPVINPKCEQYNFTNEGGVGGSIRLLKNITGMWLIQECRRIWARQGNDLGWEQLFAMADQAAPLRSLIEPDHARFVAPDDMPSEIAQFCRQTNQPIPDSEGAVIRCALESLALRYRMVLDWLEDLTGGTIRTIHIVGGGSQNQQLCQMAANACDREVVAGPVEATAMGNVIMQAVAMGDVGSIQEARQLVGKSYPTVRYEPQDVAPWDNAYERFLELVSDRR